MKVNIESIQFSASQQLIDHIETKLAKLPQHFTNIIDIEVHLLLESKAQHIKDKTVKIKINIPNHTLNATGTDKHFEVALEEATKAIEIQLKKHKEKSQNIH